jgi:hypothetical protein
MQRTLASAAFASSSPYEPPRGGLRMEDCDSYHTMEIPGHGLVRGMWDLRGGESAYLGGVALSGKRVLEVGAASGHLSFWMEGRGADVVAFDLSEEEDWDFVPYGGTGDTTYLAKRRAHIRRLHNGFWLAHEALRSKVQVVYGHASRIPEAIGPVDIATFGCVLLHLRDPFFALQSALRLTRETAIVTEPLSRFALFPRWPLLGPPLRRWIRPHLGFHPVPEQRLPRDAWWQFSPASVMAFLGVLGFGRFAVSAHRQRTASGWARLFTVVASRRRDMESPLES